jgi:hypothetical protein
MAHAFDLLLTHARTHIATPDGQLWPQFGPLPVDGPETFFVAATGYMDGFVRKATLPAGEVILAPDHSRLAVRRGDLWRAFDLQGREGFRFESDGPTFLHALHPSGEMLARRAASSLDLLLPDGKVWRSLSVSRRKPAYGKLQLGTEEMLTFSACGNYLWFAACPADGPDGLWLIRVPEWTVVERGPIPAGVDETDQGRQKTGEKWWENEMAVHPQTNVLGVSRWAGDSFLSVTFHYIADGRRVDHEYQVYGDTAFDGGTVGYLTPAGRGRWIGLSWGVLCEWDWPSLKRLECQTTGAFDYGDQEGLLWDGLAVTGDWILARCETGEIHVLQEWTLVPARTVRPFTHADVLLANGMILQNEGEAMHLLALQLRSSWDVVLELDAAARCCRKVWAPIDGGWDDFTRDFALLEPAFWFDPNG